MELHYYKGEIEDREYVTWTFNVEPMDGDYGWTKNVAPSYLDTSQEATDWYYISNEEDLLFIIKEMHACIKFCNQELTEIEVARKYNEKLGYIK